MFEDAKEELERLNRQLLEEEDEYEEEYEEDGESYEEEEVEEYDVYNGDTADVDLEEYSEQVYAEPQRSGWGLVAAILLLTTGILLLLAFLLAKRGDLL